MKKNSLLNSFKCAFNGIKSVLIKERNIKIHLFAMFLVIIFGIIFKLDKIEWIICVVCFALVIGAVIGLIIFIPKIITFISMYL